ncbi:hypothetical protein CAEBREN_05984 [Caenorhabditis brenneri]|uniref:Uncharacterized protein n=1 Tax=Caenorhabditis brenneri TaxID=135651 RepID=G0MZ02_CAEBE|nr:hypothetical protein CAEBREN_05984 [Caenorhabditis brenneri]
MISLVSLIASASATGAVLTMCAKKDRQTVRKFCCFLKSFFIFPGSQAKQVFEILEVSTCWLQIVPCLLHQIQSFFQVHHRRQIHQKPPWKVLQVWKRRKVFQIEEGGCSSRNDYWTSDRGEEDEIGEGRQVVEIEKIQEIFFEIKEVEEVQGCAM